MLEEIVSLGGGVQKVRKRTNGNHRIKKLLDGLEPYFIQQRISEIEDNIGLLSIFPLYQLLACMLLPQEMPQLTPQLAYVWYPHYLFARYLVLFFHRTHHNCEYMFISVIIC